MATDPDGDSLYRSLGAAVVLLVVVASLWYSQAPPRSSGAYHKEGVQTLEYLVSQVNTARIWVRELDQEDTTLPAASVAFRELDSDARATVSRFAGYDPPPGNEAVHRRVTALGNRAVSTLGDLRIRAHHDDVGALVRMSPALGRLVRRLERLKAAVAP